MKIKSVWLDSRNFSLWLSMAIGGGLVGLLYVSVVYPPGEVGQGSLLLGGIIGLLIGGLIAGFELFFVSHPYSMLRRLSFVPAILVRVGVQFVIISTVIAICQIVYDRINGTQIFDLSADGIVSHLKDVSFSLVVCAVIVFYLQMRIYVGGTTLLNVQLGRYNQPVAEERIFMMLDIPNTTQAAQAIGDTAFHRYLNQLFILFDRPIVRNGGEVHSYVGDALIAVWPLTDNKARNARVLSALMDVVAVCAMEADRIEARFGVRPGVRAAVHGGSVVVGETGDSKRQITYLGDVMNLTARIESKTKELDRPLLISAELLSHMTLPKGIAVEPIGAYPMKGSQRDIELAELHFD